MLESVCRRRYSDAMNATLLDAGSPSSCHPITSTRPLAEIPIGNRSLADLQRANLVQAGYHLAETGGNDDLFVKGDAWLSPAILTLLRHSRPPVAIRDPQGAVLAWVGESAQAVLTSHMLPTDESSFLIRYPWDLLAIHEQVLTTLHESRIEGDVSKAVTVDGILVLGKGSRVLPGVYIEGTVVIGDHCRIGPNCYLRGNTSIGSECYVGQATEVKNSIIMDHTALRHLSYCGDSIIGRHVNFGAGTITANFRHDGGTHRSAVAGHLVDTGRTKLGTVIGDGVHTGINTSIYPGRKLWPNTRTRPGAIVQQDLMT